MASEKKSKVTQDPNFNPQQVKKVCNKCGKEYHTYNTNDSLCLKCATK